MKTTEHFKQAIKEHLDGRAERDSLFAASYRKEGKTLDKCCDYILTQVKESGCNGFADDEIYSLAVHYYDEDDASLGKIEHFSSAQVAVNRAVELTDSERKELHDKARNDYYRQELAKMRQPHAPSAARKKEADNQPSLFDV